MHHLRLLLILTFFAFSSCSDVRDRLSGGFYYYSEGPEDSVISPDSFKDGEQFIPCNVIKYDWNDEHILAIQKVTKDCFWGKSNVPQKVGTINYWIIEVSQNKFYNLKTRKDFDQKIKQLNVSADLNFSERDFLDEIAQLLRNLF